MLYERTAVSRKPDELIARDIAALRDEDRLTPDMVFRDPYFLDFLGLSEQHAEQDVEDAILRELESFILEMGTDLTFVARQKRIIVDSGVWWRLISSWGSFRLPTKARWNCTCGGCRNMMFVRAKNHLWA